MFKKILTEKDTNEFYSCSGIGQIKLSSLVLFAGYILREDNRGIYS